MEAVADISAISQQWRVTVHPASEGYVKNEGDERNSR
jgi:hypothetical protein